MPGKNTWNTEGGPPLSGQLVHEGRTVMVQ